MPTTGRCYQLDCFTCFTAPCVVSHTKRLSACSQSVCFLGRLSPLDLFAFSLLRFCFCCQGCFSSSTMKRVRSSHSKKHVVPPLGSEVQVESLRSRLQSLLRSGTLLLSPVSLRSPTPVRVSAICKPFAKKRRLVIRSLTMRPSPVLPPPCVQDTAAQLSGPMHSQSVTVSV